MNQARMMKVLTDCGAVTAALELEHQAIENSLQALCEALLAKAPPETLAQLIDIVVNFCFEHFRNEEQEFQENGFAGAHMHASAHEKLLSNLQMLRTAISQGQVDATLEAADLINSFHYHVSQFDQPAHEYLLQQNIDQGGETPHRLAQFDHLTRAARRGLQTGQGGHAAPRN